MFKVNLWKKQGNVVLFSSACSNLLVLVLVHLLRHNVLNTNKIRGNDLFHPLSWYFWTAAGVLGDMGFLNCFRPSNIAALQPYLEWARKNQNNYINAENQSLLTLPWGRKPKSWLQKLPAYFMIPLPAPWSCQNSFWKHFQIKPPLMCFNSIAYAFPVK